MRRTVHTVGRRKLFAWNGKAKVLEPGISFFGLRFVGEKSKPMGRGLCILELTADSGHVPLFGWWNRGMGWVLRCGNHVIV